MSATAAFAYENDLTKGVSLESVTPAEVLFLNQLGLFRGTDIGFEVDTTLTREQAAALVVRLLGGEKEALAQEIKAPFTDTSGWAEPYIGWLYEKKLTNGTSDTTYSPQDLISYRHFTLFLTRALGGALSDEPPSELAPTGEELVDAGTIDATALLNASITRGKAVELSVRALRLECVDARETLTQSLISRGIVSREKVIAAADALGADVEQTLYRPSDGLLRRFLVDYRYGQESGLWQEGNTLYMSLNGSSVAVDTGLRSAEVGWCCEAVTDNTAYLLKLLADGTHTLISCDLTSGTVRTLGGSFSGDVSELVRTAIRLDNLTFFGGNSGVFYTDGKNVKQLHTQPLLGGGTPMCAAPSGVVCLLADGRLMKTGLDGANTYILNYLKGSTLLDAPELLSYDGQTLSFHVLRIFAQSMGGEGTRYIYTYSAGADTIRCTGFSCDSSDPTYLPALLKAQGISEAEFVRRQIAEEQAILDKAYNKN